MTKESDKTFFWTKTKVICQKHGTHTHAIQSTIQGHEGYWCMICALEKLGEPLPTTKDD